MDRMIRGLLFLVSSSLCFGLSNMPPEADQALAREIYKEMVEIKSGYTTGATTPVAEARRARLRAAGFPDGDIFGRSEPRPRRTWWCATTGAES
jgi:hypothetical protein